LMQHLQQLDMESNGKTVNIHGEICDCKTAPIIWGGIGTDGQHAFFQLLHQGTEGVAMDFIVAMKSLNSVGKHHALLVANCFAQARALMYGRSIEEAHQEMLDAGLTEEQAEKLEPHKVMPGNQPTNMIMLDKLTPHALGALIAMYEHKVFVQGAIWNINSFDQWGVELGKKLAAQIVDDFIYKDRSETFQAYDASTKGLIEHYWRKG